jgi:hypothetical protein
MRKSDEWGGIPTQMDENMFIIERENDTIVVKNKDGEKIMPQDCTPAEYAQLVNKIVALLRSDEL